MIRRSTSYAGVLVFAAALCLAAPSAEGQFTMPPTWRVNVTADAAAKAAGRSDYVEYIYVENISFSGDQICKLGMEQTALTLAPTATLGTFAVTCTMKSNTYGIINFSGTVSTTLMQGTMTWTVGTKVYNYSYKGVPFTPDPDAES